MEKAGVVVKHIEPSDWVNSMVAVVKPNKIFICIDPRDVNEAMRREHFPMTTIEEVRLQKMMLTLQRYDLKVKYLPGSELSVTDALSRSYLHESTDTLIPDLEVNEVHLTAHFPISPEKYAEFQKASADDATMQELSTVVLNGWPANKEELP